MSKHLKKKQKLEAEVKGLEKAIKENNKCDVPNYRVIFQSNRVTTFGLVESVVITESTHIRDSINENN